jgi:hypothetical protein
VWSMAYLAAIHRVPTLLVVSSRLRFSGWP